MAGFPIRNDGTVSVAEFLAEAGRTFLQLRDHDSGCVSYGVGLPDGTPWFVKHGRQRDAIASLQRAVAFHRSDRARMQLVDLDEYRLGPFAVETERLPGSTRFMPPVHWRRGAIVDHRSTVSLLGRAAAVLLDERWPSPAVRDVANRATRNDPPDRYPSVAAFGAAWRATMWMRPGRSE